MNTHPAQGRSGDVCPFTSQAYRIDTIRLGVCGATNGDVTSVTRTMRYCLGEFAAIPCPPAMRHFRTVIVAFPNLAGSQGRNTLGKAQRRLIASCLLRGLMIGRFHPDSDDPGLWNADFRPLRSPLPLLAIRHVVEGDAAFAARHPLLVPVYLLKYPVGGLARLVAHYLFASKAKLSGLARQGGDN
jgi:hypothetical protein